MRAEYHGRDTVGGNDPIALQTATLRVVGPSEPFGGGGYRCKKEKTKKKMSPFKQIITNKMKIV